MRIALERVPSIARARQARLNMSDWSFYDRGFSLFPLTPRTKRPAIDWEPFQFTRAAPQLVDAWRANHWNTGVATGAVSGCIVLDADSMLARIEAERRGLPHTLTIATPRGTHFYFNHPGWDVRNRAGRGWTIAPGDTNDPGVDGWDLRGDGGYVVGPGSHYVPNAEDAAKGKVEGYYTVEVDAPLADAPDWLLALTFPRVHKPNTPARVADETTSYGRAALHAEMAVLMAAADGTVNEQINLSAFAIGQLVAGGEITSDEAYGALIEALAVLGLGDEEKAQGTLERGFAAGMLVPRAVEHGGPSVTPEQALGTREPVAPPPPGTAPAPPPPTAPARFGPGLIPQFVSASNADGFFAGCVYVANRDVMFSPSGVQMSKSAFDAIYGGPEFILDQEGSKKVRSAWQFFRENSTAPMPKAWDTCFRPELPSGQIVYIENLPYLNTYVPLVTPRAEGDPAPFVDHVRKLLPDGRDAELLLHWMASAVQNPGAKFQWWPVVQGTKGNGKSLLLKVMYNAIGERYSHQVRADSVLKTANQFNDWIVGKLFLGFEEIRSSEGRRDFVEIMKDTVTADRIATEGKGRGQATSDNRANGFMLSNFEDSCPIDDDERRWGIFFCAQQSDEDMARDGMTQPYFKALYEWLNAGGYAVVTNYLATRPLEYALDPARGLQRAPVTTSTGRAVTESLGVVEQEIVDAIETEAVGFRHGVVSSLALRSLFDRMKKSIGPRRYRKIMAAVGYVTHPALEVNKGRFNNAMRDNTRPTLYFHKAGPFLAITEPADLLVAVETAMAGAVGSSNVVPLHPTRAAGPPAGVRG